MISSWCLSSVLLRLSKLLSQPKPLAKKFPLRFRWIFSFLLFFWHCFQQKPKKCTLSVYPMIFFQLLSFLFFFLLFFSLLWLLQWQRRKVMILSASLMILIRTTGYLLWIFSSERNLSSWIQDALSLADLSEMNEGQSSVDAAKKYRLLRQRLENHSVDFHSTDSSCQSSCYARRHHQVAKLCQQTQSKMRRFLCELTFSFWFPIGKFCSLIGKAQASWNRKRWTYVFSNFCLFACSQIFLVTAALQNATNGSNEEKIRLKEVK